MKIHSLDKKVTEIRIKGMASDAIIESLAVRFKMSPIKIENALRDLVGAPRIKSIRASDSEKREKLRNDFNRRRLYNRPNVSTEEYDGEFDDLGLF